MTDKDIIFIPFSKDFGTKNHKNIICNGYPVNDLPVLCCCGSGGRSILNRYENVVYPSPYWKIVNIKDMK
jgi:hypothetical protein